MWGQLLGKGDYAVIHNADSQLSISSDYQEKKNIFISEQKEQEEPSFNQRCQTRNNLPNEC